LKRDTFFEANRLFLLITPVLALVLPFLAWEALNFQALSTARVDLPVVFLNDSGKATQSGDISPSSRLTFHTIVWCIYGAGVVFNVLRFVRKMRHFRRLKKVSIPQAFHGRAIRLLPDSHQ